MKGVDSEIIAKVGGDRTATQVQLSSCHRDNRWMPGTDEDTSTHQHPPSLPPSLLVFSSIMKSNFIITNVRT